MQMLRLDTRLSEAPLRPRIGRDFLALMILDHCAAIRPIPEPRHIRMPGSPITTRETQMRLPRRRVFTE